VTGTPLSEDGFQPRGGFPPTRTWGRSGVPSPGDDALYGSMISALRDFLDGVAGAALAPATLAGLIADLRDWSHRLAPMQVSEREQMFGHFPDLPGHGQAMAPNFVVAGGDHNSVYGTVRFGRYFLGGGGAVHGGAIPLLFDDVLGRLSHFGGRAATRTAFLHTDYRSITPIDTDLDVRAWFVRTEGRKSYLRAEIKHGDVLCAEAEGLFIVLRPDQP
jgi:hypothetical protein